MGWGVNVPLGWGCLPSGQLGVGEWSTVWGGVNGPLGVGCMVHWGGMYGPLG